MVPLGVLRLLHVVAVEAAIHSVVHTEELVPGSNGTGCDCGVDGASLDLQHKAHSMDRVERDDCFLHPSTRHAGPTAPGHGAARSSAKCWHFMVRMCCDPVSASCLFAATRL